MHLSLMMDMHLSLYHSLDCTECGSSLNKADDVAGDAELNEVSCGVGGLNNPDLDVVFVRCPKCGAPVRKSVLAERQARFAAKQERRERKKREREFPLC